MTYLREKRPKLSSSRRPLFYSNSGADQLLAQTILRELSDKSLEWFSYILRKKWSDEFIDGLNTQVPGHIKVVLTNINTDGSFNPLSIGSYDSLYTNLRYSPWSEGVAGLANKERVRIVYTVHPNNWGPGPGPNNDTPSLTPDIQFTTSSTGYTYWRLDNNNPVVRTTSDFAEYGYVTTYENERVPGTEGYLVAEEFTTGMTNGVDKIKLEVGTIVNDTSLGDQHKLLLSATNKTINLKQIGTGRSLNLSHQGVAYDTTYSAGNAAEEDVIDLLFNDVEQRIRENEVGAVRIANHLQGPKEDLKNSPIHLSGSYYGYDDWKWHDLGLIFEDTRIHATTGNSPSQMFNQYNMYINKDYADDSNLKPAQPTYNGGQIKLLSAHYGTDLTDGRRLKEQEIDIASNFITNFLYKIFLRRYPVYDFTNSQYPGNGYTWMGTITDTHYSSQTVSIYGGGTSPPSHFAPYTRTTTTLADDNNVTTTSSHFQFVGLRGQANVKVRNPTL